MYLCTPVVFESLGEKSHWSRQNFWRNISQVIRKVLETMLQITQGERVGVNWAYLIHMTRSAYSPPPHFFTRFWTIQVRCTLWSNTAHTAAFWSIYKTREKIHMSTWISAPQKWIFVGSCSERWRFVREWFFSHKDRYGIGWTTDTKILLAI